MPVVNRDLDVSQQKDVFTADLGLVSTGSTIVMTVMPYPAVIRYAAIAASGVSGTPTAQLYNFRFIAGTGFTAIPLCAALTVQAVGLSGLQVFASLAAVGTTLSLLNQGDVLALISGGANSAINTASVSVVTQALQDVKAAYGTAT